MKPKLGIPCISISSPEEMNLSDKKLPNFLSSVISGDHIREQIQNHSIPDTYAETFHFYNFLQVSQKVDIEFFS
ncbi:MAG: hypothetical protein COT45_02080 [bacterium (Candidatus Stahlbacteria) CG08_land_8_20_14_0_20_40_26]|nr:MAG: hypothetical protein COX49_07430 [bacterium (Candidatus Stahlbacteria) CG23_combo_of_CG06-09_8_20_14_all_40_9]PIS25649.1 MAG: hypothetical protein COT45_02080 [bacterium (Candidatus Stahlbacteria) CG08_land_8_20_14_0_20_40_26]